MENDEQFAQLVAEHRPRLFQHCLSLVKDEESAEDLTQEALLRAYRHLSSFDGRSSLYTWIWRIAHNLCLDYLRKRRIDEELREEVVGKEERKEELTALLPLLPRKHRVVFEMYYIEQLSQREIAQRLTIPYGTVRSRLYHARQKIKRVRSKV